MLTLAQTSAAVVRRVIGDIMLSFLSVKRLTFVFILSTCASLFFSSFCLLDASENPKVATRSKKSSKISKGQYIFPETLDEFATSSLRIGTFVYSTCHLRPCDLPLAALRLPTFLWPHMILLSIALQRYNIRIAVYEFCGNFFRCDCRFDGVVILVIWSFVKIDFKVSKSATI